MSEPIRPALTPEEWAEVMSPSWEGWRIKYLSDHGAAALCLHGQPYGFTRDLLDRLRYAPTLRRIDDETFAISRTDLRILLQARTDAADRIAALLPPEDSAR